MILNVGDLYHIKPEYEEISELAWLGIIHIDEKQNSILTTTFSNQSDFETFEEYISQCANNLNTYWVKCDG